MSNIEPEPEKKKRRRDENDSNEESEPERKKTRSEENKHKCPHCSETYTQSYNLNRHIKLKHIVINNSFNCNKCSKQFYRKEHQLNHKCFRKCTRCGMEVGTKKQLLKHVCKPNYSPRRTPESAENGASSNGENEEEESELQTDEGSISESAFRRMFLTREWRIRAGRDPLSLMHEYFPALKRHLAALLKLSTTNSITFVALVALLLTTQSIPLFGGAVTRRLCACAGVPVQ